MEKKQDTEKRAYFLLKILTSPLTFVLFAIWGSAVVHVFKKKRKKETKRCNRTLLAIKINALKAAIIFSWGYSYVKGIAQSNEPTENYRIICTFHSS